MNGTEEQTSLDLGRQLRDQWLKKVTGNSISFLERMRAKALEIEAAKGTVAVDDLREYAAAEGIQPHHQNAWGAVFRKGWKAVGFRQTRVKGCHARQIRVFVVDRPDPQA